MMAALTINAPASARSDGRTRAAIRLSMGGAPHGTIDFLASTPLETPPNEGGSCP